MKASLPKALRDLPWRFEPTDNPSFFVIRARPGAKRRRNVRPMTKAEVDAFERSINEIFERVP